MDHGTGDGVDRDRGGRVQDESGRAIAHLEEGELHGGEHRMEVVPQHVLVVEADDRDVLRDRQAELVERLVCPESCAVVAAEDRGDRLLECEQRAGAVVAGAVDPLPRTHQRGLKGDACLRQRALEASAAVAGGRDALLGLNVDHADAGMSGVEQDPRRVVPALLLVRDHAGGAAGDVAGVEGDRPGLKRALRHIELAMVHRGVEDPAHLVGQHRLDGRRLQLDVTPRVDGHQGVAVLPRAVLSTLDHLAGEGRGGDLVAEQADDLRDARLQRLRLKVGAVPDALRGSADALGGGLRGATGISSAEHERHHGL